MVTLRKVLIGAVLAVFFGACILMLFLPFPRRVEPPQEFYFCEWEDGTQTKEDYFGAMSALCGATEERLILERDGRKGYILPSEEYRRAVTEFESGEAARIMSFRLQNSNRLEKAALFLRYGERCYYTGESLCWDGEKIFRTKRTKFTEVVLLSGDLPNDFLRNAGASTLTLWGGAKFTARSLVGCKVETVVAFSPYFTENGAVYLEDPSGTRLVAALPNTEVLEINCDYIDFGALSACKNLKKLKLPQRFDGTLAELFGSTPVPEDLVLL